MAEIDYKKLADDTKKDWGELFTRLEEDDKLVNLAKYTLLDPKNAEIPHALSLTLNDIGVFDNKVETFLGAAKEQVMVKSEDKGLDTSKIETVITAAFNGANQLLANQQESPLNMAIDQQNCRRGGSAAKVIFDVDPKTNELTPQIRVLDRGGLTFGVDKKGLTWTSYETPRNRNQILTDYPDFPESRLGNKTEGIKIQDIWTREFNKVWIEGNLVLEEPNNFKSIAGSPYVPVVVRIVPMGNTYGSIKFWGESLFFLIRDLVPELNRLVSIAQSLNQKALDHALQFKVPSDELPLGEIPDHDQLTDSRSVTAVPIGGGVEYMPIGQLTEMAWRTHQMIETRIQRGGANAFDLGTFNQSMSGIALIEVAEGREQIYLPRLGTRGLLKDGIAEMLVDQILTSGVSQVKLGRQTYQVSDLEGAYDITHKYTNKSPGKDVARWQMYATAGDGVSKKYKDTIILELEDPEGEDRQRRIEEAEIIFPSVKKARTIIALAEDAEAGDKQSEIDLELALEELGVTLDDIMAGDISPTQGIPDEPQKPNALGLSQPLSAAGRAGASPVEQLIGGNGGSEK